MTTEQELKLTIALRQALNQHQEAPLSAEAGRIWSNISVDECREYEKFIGTLSRKRKDKALKTIYEAAKKFIEAYEADNLKDD